jgi:hypothetical protein
MLIASIVFLALAAIFMIGEAIAERDWPRETYKYGLIAAALVVFWLTV